MGVKVVTVVTLTTLKYINAHHPRVELRIQLTHFQIDQFRLRIFTAPPADLSTLDITQVRPDTFPSWLFMDT